MSYDPNEAKSLFLQALELNSARERADFVAQTCIDRPELKSRVEQLLRTALDPDSLLDQPLQDIGLSVVDAPPTRELPADFLDPCNVPGALGSLAGHMVLEVIGRGGMGIVLRAQDCKLNRIVAIKVLVPEFAGNLQARRRFLREAQAAAAVSHDHVVTIYAVDDDRKLPYLVMECISGQSLQQKIDKTGPLGLREIVRIGMQTAAGLAAAHGQGLVHRDIKPANILLENGVERVKLTDFGLARMIDDSSVTQSGVIAGTPQYMSPEQARGESVDHRSDLFSLGSVLYAMCVGHAPFRASTTMGVLKRVCDDAPQAIREQNGDIPEWLVRIIETLMAKSASQRFQTAAEVSELLRQGLVHLQCPTSTPLPDAIRTLPGPAKPAPRRNPDRAFSVYQRRARWLLLATVLTLILGALNLAQLNLSGRNIASLKKEPIQELKDVLPQPIEKQPTETTPTEATPTDPPSSPTKPPASAIAPFDAARAKELQIEWAVHLGLPLDLTNPIGMKLRLIPPGKFQMGSTPEELDALNRDLEKLGASGFDRFVAQSSGPRHGVEISEAFYMGAYEVTVGEFRKFIRETNYQPSAARAADAKLNWEKFAVGPNSERLPVCGVSWDDAQAFCRWLTEKSSQQQAVATPVTAETPAIAPAASARENRLTYDLPTEAQWEYACRAGTSTKWCCGDNVETLTEFAVFAQKGAPQPARVGLKRANAFGLCDMHGNVDEWCRDWHNNRFYGISPAVDPWFDESPSEPGSGRVARGGAWNADAWWSASATRAYDFPTVPTFAKGFRVVGKIVVNDREINSAGP